MWLTGLVCGLKLLVLIDGSCSQTRSSCCKADLIRGSLELDLWRAFIKRVLQWRRNTIRKNRKVCCQRNLEVVLT